MASYIGKVQIGETTPVLVGSTLYGVCHTAAATALKDITEDTISSQNKITGDYVNTRYDTAITGTTIHIKFVYGNTVTSNTQLKVGTLITPLSVVGNFTCPANTIISFTLDENNNWVVNDNVDTNTEYVFKTAYNASTNKALTESDIAAAATKGVITDIANNISSTDLPTTAAVAQYVQDLTGGLSGLSGAMHFRGMVTDQNVTITDGGTQMPHINGYDYENGAAKQNFTPEPGDVILFGQQEFVWANNKWELLGDQGSYALNSNVDTITEVSNFTTNTLPTLTPVSTTASSVSVTNGSAASLTTNNVTIPNVTSAGSAATASVSGGVLTITPGVAPTIAATPITVKEVNVFTANTPTAVTSVPVTFDAVSNWNAGSQAVLSTNNTTVVVPTAPNP